MTSDNKSHEVENLKTAIDELRRVYDWLCNAYSELKVKILAFVGGALATMTFLYSDRETFIPEQTYGKIFYFAGLGLVILALGYLFMAMQPKHWEFPTEHKDLEDPKFQSDFTSEKKYLLYVKNRYLLAYSIDIKVYEIKQGLTNKAFYMLIAGAIILIVLKLFGTEGVEQLCRSLME